MQEVCPTTSQPRRDSTIIQEQWSVGFHRKKMSLRVRKSGKKNRCGLKNFGIWMTRKWIWRRCTTEEGETSAKKLSSQKRWRQETIVLTLTFRRISKLTNLKQLCPAFSTQIIIKENFKIKLSRKSLIDYKQSNSQLKEMLKVYKRKAQWGEIN